MTLSCSGPADRRWGSWPPDGAAKVRMKHGGNAAATATLPPCFPLVLVAPLGEERLN